MTMAMMTGVSLKKKNKGKKDWFLIRQTNLK